MNYSGAFRCALSVAEVWKVFLVQLISHPVVVLQYRIPGLSLNGPKFFGVETGLILRLAWLYITAIVAPLIMGLGSEGMMMVMKEMGAEIPNYLIALVIATTTFLHRC